MSHKKSSGKRGKKKCDRGNDCPYKHEYQHQLEFYHEGDNNDFVKTANKEKPFIPFAGKGNVASKSSNSNLLANSLSSSSSSSYSRRVGGQKNSVRSQRLSILQKNDPTLHKCTAPFTNKNSSTASKPINTLHFTKVNSGDKRNRHKLQSRKQIETQTEIGYVDLVDCDSPSEKKLIEPLSHINDVDIAVNRNVENNEKIKKTTKRKIQSTTALPIVDLCGDDTDDDDDSIVFIEAPTKRKKPKIYDASNIDSSQNFQSIENVISDSLISSHNWENFIPNHPKISIPLENFYSNGVSGTDDSSIHPWEQEQISKAIIESNREVKISQDEEYYESLRLDQEKERKRKQKEMEQRALIEIKQKREEEEELAKQNRVLDNKTNLLPEPPETTSQVVTIAFRLPTKCPKPRLVRRFLKTSSVDQMFFFLNSSEEMLTVPRWKLFPIVGGVEISQGGENLIQDLGLGPRGLVIVRDENS